MSPLTRVRLFVAENPKKEVFEVWELCDREPPSTAPELEPSKNRERDDGTSSEPAVAKPERCQLCLPALVMEVSADGEVIAWPGPEVLA